ncbi:MAG TPA: beta-galactosidase [Rugosimonospora sp.]
MRRLRIVDGISHVDGIASDFATWEYPYFRDSAGNWPARLHQLRELGARIVSSYVPWRHHEVAGPDGYGYDFDGHTQANRNLSGFLDECARAGLSVMLKPGPFCHAELNYGGLPDRVCPLWNDSIAAQLDCDGKPVTWGGSTPTEQGEMPWWPLPSPHDPDFLAEADEWLRVVRARILLPAAENRTLVAVQVGNEGIYTDAARPIWAHDYSAPALAGLRDWLRDRYRDLTEYNRAHGSHHPDWSTIEPPRRYTQPTDAAELLAYQDFSRWRAQATTDLLHRWSRTLDLPVETMTNVNPPTGDPWGIDAWLARNRPADWAPVHYGYTNWIGLAAVDESALARYMFVTRVRRGPNIEENWGFSGHYDPRYEHANICFQQTLVALAGGASGINVYTAVGTDAWDPGLDAFGQRPYPTHPPIDPSGATGPKARLAADLFRYLGRVGAELAASVPVGGVAWGLDTDAATWAAWTGDEGLRLDGRHFSAPGAVYLASHPVLNRAGIDLDLVDLADGDLTRFAAVVLAGVPAMARHRQQRLADYTRSGGHVFVIGEPPTADERSGPCRLLADAAVPVAGPGHLAAALSTVAGVRPIPHTGDALVWVREHAGTGATHVIVVTREDDTTTIDLGTAGNLTVRAAPESGALLRLTAGAITGALIRGRSERRDLSCPPRARWATSVVGQATGDLLLLSPSGLSTPGTAPLTTPTVRN